MMKKITTLMIALLAGMVSWAQCDATFISVNTGNGQMYFYTLDSTLAGTYVWSMGNGDTQTTLDGDTYYSYNANGAYAVCLTYDDGMGCTDTYCDSVVIGNTPPPQTPCSADFYSWNNGNNNDVALYAADSTQIGTYTWEMGDGTVMTTTTGEAFYTYGSSGLYFACLTFDDGMGCTDTYCDSVYV